MPQFYAKSEDEERCRKSIRGRHQTALTGLTIDGRVDVFTGKVQSVERGSSVFPGYPLRVTISDRNNFS
jgi:hypothetical protein